jgi:hypothetical protein
MTEQNVAIMKLNGAPDVNTHLKSSLLHPIRDYQIQACTDLGIAIASRLAPTVDRSHVGASLLAMAALRSI